MMDADAVDQLLKFDAIYLGAIGDPKVPDHISAGELLLPLRHRLLQYVNLRPCGCCPGIASPLADRGAADIDMVCVRENSEGEYCGVGGRVHAGTPDESPNRQGYSRGADRADRALRLPDGRIASEKAAGERDEVERAAAFDGAVGRSGRTGLEGVSRR